MINRCLIAIKFILDILINIHHLGTKILVLLLQASEGGGEEGVVVEK